MSIKSLLKDKYIRNLLIAILIYVMTPIIMCLISMLSNIIYLDGANPEDETIFILSILATSVFSLVCYLIFFGTQRKIANKPTNAKFLGIGKRVFGGIIAAVIAAITLFGMSFIVSPYGDNISLLRLYTETMIIFLVIFVIINFVVFIVLKPRP